MQLNPSVSVMNAEITDSCTHVYNYHQCTAQNTKQTNKQKQTAGYLTI